MTVKPIPTGYHTVTPYLTIQNVPALIDFLKKAFDAKEAHHMAGPDGKVMHADVMVGDSHIMLGEARGEWKPMPTSLYLYVNDVDATYKRAVSAGAKSLREPTNEFYGDRSAGVTDPSGMMWWIATHIEDVAPDELAKRAAAAAAQMKK
jgi:PhnB protein